MGLDLDALAARFEAAVRDDPEAGFKLVGLAEAASMAKDPERAVALARRALAAAPGDPATRMRARRLLGSLLPGYHVPMMNDARRNAAWDAALRAAIRPGMLVYEIGTGAGMLALIAARAGAEVVTSETNKAAAAMARALAGRNGLADRIKVIAKDSREVAIGEDLPRRADLLLCDIFADELLGFDPLPAIHDARERLLAGDAASVPAAVGLVASLAAWDDHDRLGRIGTAAGFDLRDFADFVPASIRRPIDAPGVALLSEPVPVARFPLPAVPRGSAERGAVEILVTRSGEANAIARWIRLELDAERVLEARPEPGGIFFSGFTLAPLDAPVAVEAGDVRRIGTFRNGRAIDTWLE
ncbi:MAG TPA: 50S ribosomal protein L11 methyltransferase [Allosphingosinicella sp.]|nr:50S ribosomal protein L11 methyltransferase [Allosphingosinicella sp.]